MKLLLAAFLSVSILSVSSAAFAQQEPDNTSKNKKQGVTAEQQGTSKEDLDMTKQVRQALVADKSLSTYGHNVKVVTRDGMVTLRGPVSTEEEKMSIEGTVSQIAGGASHITNHLQVTPKKQ